jgi:lipopolysaccharide transport protein LptA
MWTLALLAACAGHAEPAGPAELQAEGVVLSLPDGTELAAESASIGPEGKGTAETVLARDGSLEIQAPHTEWDLKTRTARMSGGVVAKRGDVVLRCAEMTVLFSGRGRVERVVANGDVRIAHGHRRGQAGHAVLTTKDGRIVLTRSPVLVDGANRMSGAKIVLHMDEDKVICEQCRVRIAPEAVATGAEPQ